jgi:hypothetical protein
MNALKVGNGFLLKSFVDHKVDIKPSQEMIEAAVERQDFAGLIVLLERGNPRELISDKLLDQLAGDERGELMTFLQEHGVSCPQ